MNRIRVAAVACALLASSLADASTRSETANGVARTARKTSQGLVPMKVRGRVYVAMPNSTVAHVHRNGDGMTIWPLQGDGKLGKAFIKKGSIASVNDAWQLAIAQKPVDAKALAARQESHRRWLGKVHARFFEELDDAARREHQATLSSRGRGILADVPESAVRRGGQVTLPAGAVVTVADGQSAKTYRLKRTLTGSFAGPHGLYLRFRGSPVLSVSHTNPLVEL